MRNRTAPTTRLITAAMILGLAITSMLVSIAAPTGVADAADDGFVAITPTRMLDTRDGTGGREGPLGAGESMTLRISDTTVVPSNATAVVINVTSTQATAESFVTIWPSGLDQPVAASLNLDPGQDTPNLVIVGLENQSIDIYNHIGTTHLVGDVTGYFLFGSDFTPLAPARLLDTRDGTGGTTGPVAGDSTVTLQVRNVAGVPETASAVVVNVTAVRATSPAFVTVYPTGSQRPLAASLNTEPGQNSPNLVIARLGSGGQIDLYLSAGASHLTADVMGYYGSGDEFVPATPTRILDTREGVGAPLAPLGEGEELELAVAGVGPIPDDAVAVVINITSIRATSRSFVTAWPADELRPLAASLNTEPGQNTPNLAVLKLGGNGALKIFNSRGTTHLTADVAGWFVDAPPEPRVLDLSDRSQATLSGTGFVEDSFGFAGGNYTWNTTTRRLEVEAGASAFTVAQDFDAVSRLRADFAPYTPTATFDIDIDWWGTMTSFAGVSAAAEMTLLVRLIKRTGSGAGSSVWQHTFVSDGIGSGLKALEVLKIEDREIRTFDLPTLDPDESYRMEVEVRCRAKVVFSIGATTCDVRTGDRDVVVNDWSLTFTE